MKKKQSKKKTQFKKKKNYSEKTAFANLEKASSTETTSKKIINWDTKICC